MRSKNTYSLKLISQYRSLMMGIAIVMITFCHPDVALKHNGLPVTKIASLLHLCTVGVDFFMFLSGFGLWYSLRKKRNYRQFAKRRIKKLLPMYLIIAGVTYFLYDLVINQLGIQRFAEDLTFISWYKAGSTRYWFVPAILIFSLIFPLIFEFIENEKIQDSMKLIVFFAVFFIVTAILDSRFELYESFRIAIERLPIFVLGAFCGKKAEKDAEISISILAVLICLGLLFTGAQYLVHPFRKWVMNTHYMYYLSRALLGLALIALICAVSAKWESRSESYRKAIQLFAYLGGITYEVYLFHQSYMILFEFPPSVCGYLCAAVVMPLCSGIVLSHLLKRRSRMRTAS